MQGKQAARPCLPLIFPIGPFQRESFAANCTPAVTELESFIGAEQTLGYLQRKTMAALSVCALHIDAKCFYV